MVTKKILFCEENCIFCLIFGTDVIIITYIRILFAIIGGNYE